MKRDLLSILALWLLSVAAIGAIVCGYLLAWMLFG